MSSWSDELELYHGFAVNAAVEGVQDPALGGQRLTGPDVRVVAEAAVTSATPFLRAPILARIHEALQLHRPGPTGECPTCVLPHPCPTTQTLTPSPPR